MPAEPALIPHPATLIAAGGEHRLTPDTRLVCDRLEAAPDQWLVEVGFALDLRRSIEMEGSSPA